MPGGAESRPEASGSRSFAPANLAGAKLSRDGGELIRFPPVGQNSAGRCGEPAGLESLDVLDFVVFMVGDPPNAARGRRRREHQRTPAQDAYRIGRDLIPDRIRGAEVSN